jgi:ribosomal protein S18 acetylase RimI-like enzyme
VGRHARRAIAMGYSQYAARFLSECRIGGGHGNQQCANRHEGVRVSFHRQLAALVSAPNPFNACLKSGLGEPWLPLFYIMPGDPKRAGREVDMDEHRIRAATVADVPAITDIVDQAYRHYVDRIGKPPGPMLDDYAARVSEGVVWVLEEGAVIAGIIVLLPRTSYLLLDNVAISPARQGSGLGRRLLAFAEAEALRRGYNEIRLYTHQTMVENQRLYASIGYEETGRGTEAGYDRVFMRKQLLR